MAADDIVLGRHRYYRRSDRDGDWWSDSGMVGYRQADALDEIERLRAELNAWRRAVSGTERLLDRARAESESLRQDRDRLQALIAAARSACETTPASPPWALPAAIKHILAAATKDDDRG